MEFPDFLRPEELAKKLNITVRTVRSWQKARVIPYIKVGRSVRFDPARVVEALSRFERKEIAGGAV
jgi:excisionase family DNA binding protein